MTKLLLLASTLLAATAGCATDATVPHGDLDQLATFTSTTGTTVELYTAGSGYLAVELGPAELPRVLDDIRGLSLADAYRIASGQQPPADLEALSLDLHAVERVDNSGRTPSHEQSRPEPHAPGIAYLSSSGPCSAQFMLDHGHCSFSGDSVSWALLDWHNGAYEHLDSYSDSGAFLCPASGNVVWEINNGDGGHHQWTVPQGYLYTYSFGTGDLWGTWINYDVTHAEGDRFQFCGWAD